MAAVVHGRLPHDEPNAASIGAGATHDAIARRVGPDEHEGHAASAATSWPTDPSHAIPSPETRTFSRACEGMELLAECEGLECTIAAADDVDAVAAAVKANGGRILMEKATIPGVGDLIWFEDPELSVAGAMRYEARGE